MRKIYELKVSIADNGDVQIEQGDDRDGSYGCVYVSQDQIDLLCSWLQEAKTSDKA